MPARGQALPVQADRGERQPGGREREPSPHRRVAQAALQVQGQHEEEPAEHGQHAEQCRDPGRRPGQPQQPAGDQRGTTARGDPALHHGEQDEQHAAGGEASPAPGGPVFGLAEHQGQDQGQHGRRQRGHPRQVQRAARLATAVRQGPQPGQEQDRPDRDVQQKCRSPGEAQQVCADQHAADDLPGHHAAGQHRRVQAHRAAAGRTGEGPLDQAEDLRDHGRRPGALDEAQRDQDGGRGGQAAAERGKGERGQAGQEHAPVAEDVTDPGPGDQEHRVGDHVPGDNKLQASAGGVQAGMDRGGRDIDHGGVEHGHELPRENHHERRPGAPGGPLGGAGRPGNGEGVCHDYQPAFIVMPVPRACLSWY